MKFPLTILATVSSLIAQQSIVTQIELNGGTFSPAIRSAFLDSAEIRATKSLADSGFSIRPLTLQYIKSSDMLRSAVYGSLKQPDPHVIRNIDSLLIQSELAGDPDFWKTRENLLISASFGRRGFGVGELAQLGRKLLINTGDLNTARSKGVSFSELMSEQYLTDLKTGVDRRERNKVLLTEVETKINSWIGKEQVLGMDEGPNFWGGKLAGLLERSIFTYGQVLITPNLKDSITAMMAGSEYSSVTTLLGDTRNYFDSVSAQPRSHLMPLYDFYKMVTTWQATPKENLNWNPLISQSSRDKMPHPVYKLNDASWPLLLTLSRSYQKDESDFIYETFLGNHKMQKGTTTLIPSIHSYGPYRSDTDPYYLIKTPLKGYVSAITGGGVCGTMSGIEMEAYTPMGKPISKAGQPGHSNTAYFDRTAEGVNTAGAGQSVSADEYTSTENWFRDSAAVGYNTMEFPLTFHRGLAYSANIGIDSWIDSRIAFHLWRDMSDEQKAAFGNTFLLSVLTTNPGHTQAVYSLLRNSMKVSVESFTATYDAIIGSINGEIAKQSNATMKQQYQMYRDLITYYFIENAFTDSNYWPMTASDGLSAWLKTKTLDDQPDASSNEYGKQNERFWRISDVAKTALTKFEFRRVTGIKITAPTLKDSTNYKSGTDYDANMLIDGNTSTRYKGPIGSMKTPYEFVFTFPEVYDVAKLNMSHSGISNNMEVKEYQFYWSEDSITWQGPLAGTFTDGTSQTVLFNADTTFIQADTVEQKDSNGVVFDTTVIEADTIIATNGVPVKYLRYVPISNHVNSTFAGIIAQEFEFTYIPKKIDIVSTLNSNKTISGVNMILHSTGISLNSKGIEPIRLFTLTGRLAAVISPTEMGDRQFYAIDKTSLASSVYIVQFPKSTGVAPIKLRF